ncbi:MAG: hypothetical protein ACFWTJ_09100 [Lachnoclostridium sp.]|jgi:F0F1-type ATP synthase assembly protein I
MSLIRNALNVFVYITTGIIICAAVFMTIFNRNASLSFLFLWQIILMSAVCSIGIFIFMSNKTLSKKQVMARYVIHYLYNALVVMSGSIIFDWIRRPKNLLLLYLLFTICYILITLSIIKKDKKIADEVNKRLKEYHMNDE